MPSEQLALQSPSKADAISAFKDMATLRGLPPAMLSGAAFFLLTGSLVHTALALLITSYSERLWARCLKPA